MAETDFRWTQDDWGGDVEVQQRRLSSRNEKLAWFGVITLAVVAFETTADPALSTALGCLKFGWNEVRLARWLRRTDPDPKRGRICSRFYLAWGLWRVSLVATAMMFVLAFAYTSIEGKAPGGRRPGGPPPGFITAVLLAMAGFLLCSMVSSVAVISALRHKVRIWLGPEVGWARQENLWPPQAARRRRQTTNRTKTILLSALITGGMFGLLIIVLPLSNILHQHQASQAVFGLFVMVSVIVIPVLILIFLDKLGARMIASTPAECWTTPSDHLQTGVALAMATAQSPH